LLRRWGDGEMGRHNIDIAKQQIIPKISNAFYQLIKSARYLPLQVWQHPRLLGEVEGVS
jgi:hypothetical protein